MYRGFYVSPSDDYKEYRKVGEKLFADDRVVIKTKLDSFVLPGGSLDGTKMQNNWFGQKKFDVFISHSHADADLAIGLAGWLHHNFKIKAFIDSCVWGYADDLLRQIDKKYCPTGEGTYDYHKRNSSTSHVHMMLSTALSMMMHNTECLFFLKTANSVSLTASRVIAKTESPWLYNEIAMSQLLEHKTPPRRLRPDARFFSKAEGGPINEDLKIAYDLSIKDLTPLGGSILELWKTMHNGTSAEEALDELYDLKPLPKPTVLHG